MIVIFGWWKAHTEDFIQDEEYEWWDRKTMEPTIPTKTTEGGQVPKVQSKFTVDDPATLRKNVKAKNILYVD